MDSRDEGELVSKLVWRVKLVAEFEAGETTEVEVARALVHLLRRLAASTAQRYRRAPYHTNTTPIAAITFRR